MLPHAALSITKAASTQTYYTIRFMVDRERVDDAYRAYGYFRWVDDTLDADSCSRSERTAFLLRQKELLDRCYAGDRPRGVTVQEQWLVELVERNPGIHSGMAVYLHNMMRVMDFDAQRRGRLISQAELDEYTHWLASAVTEAMHYFVGNGCYAPQDETRYLAVAAAHITHMLRDTLDDVQVGYYNIPREALEAGHIRPQDVHSEAYRAWVKGRVQQARGYFETGGEYLARVQNWRCRLAGFAYMARFEWLLGTIEREGYRLRAEYCERKRPSTGLRMGWHALSSMLSPRGTGTLSGNRLVADGKARR